MVIIAVVLIYVNARVPSVLFVWVLFSGVFFSSFGGHTHTHTHTYTRVRGERESGKVCRWVRWREGGGERERERDL